MRRLHFTIALVAALVIVWILLRPVVESDKVWYSLPFVVVGLFGLYSLLSILKSVFSLKDFPEESLKLKEDVERAKNFYRTKKL